MYVIRITKDKTKFSYLYRPSFSGLPSSSPNIHCTQQHNTAAMTVPKLTQQSPAMILLRKKFETGEIDGTEGPKKIWESEELFRKHKLSTFRAQFNRVRKGYNDGKLI